MDERGEVVELCVSELLGVLARLDELGSETPAAIHVQWAVDILQGASFTEAEDAS